MLAGLCSGLLLLAGLCSVPPLLAELCPEPLVVLWLFVRLQLAVQLQFAVPRERIAGLYFELYGAQPL